VTIDSDAQNDLELSEADADGVVGGNKAQKKSAHHKHGGGPAASRGPLMIKQTVTYGPTEISSNSGDDDCAPDPSSPDASP
jgi:hypothetical protein